MNKRTFIAVDILPNSDLTDLYILAKQQLPEEQIKWVDPGVFHLTLRFIGDTPSHQIQVISEKLSEIAGITEKFDLQMGGLGFFERNRMPTVLFCKIQENDALNNLERKMDAELKRIGFDGTNQVFKPHLTFGRIKNLINPGVFRNLISQKKIIEIQKVAIHEFVFYESILHPRGPEYKPISRHVLS